MDHRPLRARAFSLVELLVVIGIIIILIAIFLPYLTKIRESSRREICDSNLREIMVGLRNYANLNNHKYPSVVYDSVHNPNGYVAYTGASSPSPFGKSTKVQPNDVTASLWLLVRGGMVSPKAFICPSTSNSPDPARFGNDRVAVDERSNFKSGRHLSYSYSSPFSSAPNYKMDDTQPADFALLADKNPGIDGLGDNVMAPTWDASPFELAKANSNNHRKAGQNVLYADGHVAFQPTPYCGYGVGGKRDNIYTALSPIPLAPGQRPPVESPGFYSPTYGPAWTNDSYLVPTDDE